MRPFHRSITIGDQTHMSFTAVLGLDVLQHGLSRQRAWISNASVKASDSLCVCAGTTDKGRTSVISTDAVHNRRVHNLLRCSM